MAKVEFRLLGGVDAHVDGQPVPLGTAKQRCLLALLLLDVNAPIHVDRLIGLLWVDQVPAEARASVQVYISRLRRALADHADVALVTTGPCYQLRADADQIDLHRFRRLVAEAAGHPDDEAVRLYRRALSLWRGPALDDVAPPHLRQTVCANLNDERLAAWESLIDVELRRGNHAALLREVADLTEQHPLHEGLAAQRMIALYRSGQHASALAHFQTIRARLSTELGMDPSAALSALHQRMLRNDPTLAADGQPPPAAESVPATPAQLPADLATFTGRAEELRDLPRPEDMAGIAATVAIDGMAGVGKTALAVHWAHRIRDHFPDGQFFLDLHGHTRDVEPVDPATALDRMLRDLGLPGARIPHELDARAALYRSVLAGRRMLILLDSVVSESQVLPLLPGTPGCLAVITSRRRLIGLDAAFQLSLDVPPPPDAVALFTLIAGARTRADEAAAGELAALVGHLPLAVRVAAARLRARPVWTTAHLVRRLRDEHRRLVELDAGQRGIEAAFTLSSVSLRSDQRRLYRLLGLHPGPEYDAYAAAALTGGAAGHAGQLLEQLVDENLLQSHRPDRYQMHDLLRVHAAGRAQAEESEADRRAALTRLFAYYAETAAAATHLLYPHDARPEPESTEVAPVAFAGPAQAAAWLDAELPNVLATAGYATRHGWPDYVTRVSWALWRHLAERSQFTAASVLHGHAMESARLSGDIAGQARALVDLGTVHGRQGRFDQAVDHFQRALPLYRETGDLPGEARAMGSLGLALDRTGDYQRAVEYLEQALDLQRRSGAYGGEASTMGNLGMVYGRLGRYEDALGWLERALARHRELGNRGSEVRTLNNIGIAHARLGHLDEALDCQRRSIDLLRELGNEDQTGEPLAEIGNLLRQRGEYDQALEHHRQALAVFRRVDVRGSESATLNDLGLTLRAAGRPAEALDRHRDGLRIAEQASDRYEQARALYGMADAHRDLGDPERARRHWQRALEIFTELGTPEADEVRAQLARPVAEY